MRVAPGGPGWTVNGVRLDPTLAHPERGRSRLRGAGLDVQTPEHLLAALVLRDLDGLAITIDGPEVPILDGSASPWLAALAAAGVQGEGATDLSLAIQWRGRTACWSGDPGVGRARTFGDRRAVREPGAFPGARAGCAVILDGGGALYGGRPRMADEPLRHKLLDLLGDLGPWRAQGRVVGAIEVHAPSHLRNPGAIAAAFRSGRLRYA